jgi:hypothetical protein
METPNIGDALSASALACCAADLVAVRSAMTNGTMANSVMKTIAVRTATALKEGKIPFWDVVGM